MEAAAKRRKAVADDPIQEVVPDPLRLPPVLPAKEYAIYYHNLSKLREFDAQLRQVWAADREDPALLQQHFNLNSILEPVDNLAVHRALRPPQGDLANYPNNVFHANGFGNFERRQQNNSNDYVRE